MHHLLPKIFNIYIDLFRAIPKKKRQNPACVIIRPIVKNETVHIQSSLTVSLIRPPTHSENNGSQNKGDGHEHQNQKQG